MAQLPSSYVMQTNDNDLYFTCFVLLRASVHDTLHINLCAVSATLQSVAFRFGDFSRFISPPLAFPK